MVLKKTSCCCGHAYLAGTDGGPVGAAARTGAAVSLGILGAEEPCGGLWTGPELKPCEFVDYAEDGEVNAVMSWCYAVGRLVKELRDVFVYHAEACVRSRRLCKTPSRYGIQSTLSKMVEGCQKTVSDSLSGSWTEVCGCVVDGQNCAVVTSLRCGIEVTMLAILVGTLWVSYSPPLGRCSCGWAVGLCQELSPLSYSGVALRAWLMSLLT